MQIVLRNYTVYDQYVEIDLDDADRSDARVEVSDNYASWSGTVNAEVQLEIDELVVEATDYPWSNKELQELCDYFGYEQTTDLSGKFSYELVDELISRNMNRKDTLRIIERLAAAQASTDVEHNDE